MFDGPLLIGSCGRYVCVLVFVSECRYLYLYPSVSQCLCLYPRVSVAVFWRRGMRLVGAACVCVAAVSGPPGLGPCWPRAHPRGRRERLSSSPPLLSPSPTPPVLIGCPLWVVLHGERAGAGKVEAVWPALCRLCHEAVSLFDKWEVGFTHHGSLLSMAYPAGAHTVPLRELYFQVQYARSIFVFVRLKPFRSAQTIGRIWAVG